MTEDTIKTFFQTENVSAYGTASAEAMSGEAPGHKPADILPGCRSLLCFALPLPKGAYLAAKPKAETTWRSQNLYYRRLDDISVRLAALIEESGGTSVPIFGCSPVDINSKRIIVGHFNQIRMGELCGIGIRGKNGLLLNSSYGSRLMLGGILTTAVLPELREPGQIEAGCPTDCSICIDSCPVGAILPRGKKVNIMRCLKHTARIESMSMFMFLLLLWLKPRSAAGYLNRSAFDEHTFHICSKCVELCPYGKDRDCK